MEARFSIVFFLLLALAAHGQPHGIDTLAEARALAYAGRFGAANKLLARYALGHDDLETMRLRGEVLYWSKHYPRARRWYKAALRAYPDEPALQLDYARMLVGLDRRRAARKWLKLYRRHDPDGAEARLLLATLDYYNGHPRRARKALQKLRGHAPARTLLTEIDRATRPYGVARTIYQRDDQPLQGATATAAGGVYRSWLLAPRVDGVVSRFLPRDVPAIYSASVRAGNTVRLEPLGLSVHLSAGFFKHRLDAGPAADWIGRAALIQRLPVRGLTAELSAAREPYQNTVLAATRQRVLTTTGSATLRYAAPGQTQPGGPRYQAELAAEQQRFGDTNRVETLYGWAMARVLYRARFALQLGYGFSFSTAQRNTYASVQSLPRLLAAYPAAIPGSYGAYFTPTEQYVHRALAAAHWQPHRRFTASARVSHGIYARAANPYLYLDQSDADGIFVHQAFSPRRFTPREAQAALTWQGLDVLSVGIDYQYAELFFYKMQQAQVFCYFIF